MVFDAIPDTAVVTVYPVSTEDNPTPEAIPAEEDGSFLLLPGEYSYNAEAEGYVSVEGVPFTVTGDEQPLMISVVMEAIAEEMPEPVAFDQSKTVSGVVVTVQADAGAFPVNAVLSVSRVPVRKRRAAESAIDEVRDEDQNVAVSYTFDIKVLDTDGNELQPAEGQTVNVSFALAEVADENLETQVYHVTEEEATGELTAEALDVTTEVTPETGEETTAVVETNGFSIYQVEFTYNKLEYVLPGDSAVPMSEILNTLGLTGEVTAVEVSDTSLFSASNETGEWIVTAHQAFSSTEWMKVTINGVAYEITVTDTQAIPTTIGGTDYTLFTGFTATDGTAVDNAFVYENAVDGSTSTSWHPQSSNTFVEFNTDDPIIPKGYIFNTYMEGYFYPQAWVLKAKANTTDGWTTLSSYSGQTLSSGQEFQYACSNDGNTAYKYFRFEASNTANNIWLTEIRLYGNEYIYYTHLTVTPATCTATGIKQECYKRSDGKYFTDETGATELAESDVIAPMIAHTGVHQAADANHIEYWQCSMCNKCFSDEACTQEVTADEVLKTVFGTLTAGTNGASGYYTLESKTYTLTGDVNTAGYIYVPEGVTATIDLAGNTIDRGLTSAVEKGMVIWVAGSLTVTDSGTGGKIKGGMDSEEHVSCVKVYSDNGSPTFTLQGGTLIGNTSHQYNCAVLAPNSSNITISGGKITGDAYGILSNGNVAVSGGEISGNTTGIYSQNNSVSVSGNPVITNNTDANVVLYYADASVLTIAGKLTAGANIGITKGGDRPTDNAPVTFTSGYSTYNSEPIGTYFSLDNNGQIQTGPSEYITLVMGWNEDRTEIAVGTATRTVTFDLRGHGSAIDAVSLLSGYKLIELTEPTAEGWSFGGWFTDEDCTDGNEWDFDSGVTSDMTLYALWTQGQTYRVTLPENMIIVSADNEAVGGKYPSGTNIRFKVKSADYVVDGDVKNGDDVLTADDDGIYTITVADADITITATVKKAAEPNKTLSGSESYTAKNGDVLTGSTSGTVTIADGASITLSDVAITGGIVCNGTATITLVGTNGATGIDYQSAGIQIGGSGTTLTICGNGTLTATGGNQSAGIGLSRAWDPANDVIGGDIVIEGGNITANCGSWGAGIGTGVIYGNGSAKTARIGNITIKGGTVKATGGTSADGIGTGYTYSPCTNAIGTVTIYDGIDKVDASSIKDFASVVYMHDETNVNANKTDYFAIGENGNRKLIVQKPVIAEIADQTYTGSEITPEPQVKIGSLSLTKGTDYEYSYYDNTNVGTATVRATFQGDYASLGYVEKTFTIVPSTIMVSVAGGGTVTIGDKSATDGEAFGVMSEKGTSVVLALAPESGNAVRSVEYGYTNSVGTNMSGAKLPISDGTATLTVPNDLKDGTGVTLTVTFAAALVGGADEASAVALTDNTVTDLAGGWYKVESDITFDHTLNLLGGTHLIIAEGATMTVSTTTGKGIDSDYTLTVCGAGALSVTASGDYQIAVRVGNYIQTGATVTASGFIGIRCCDDLATDPANAFTFSGGQLTATGTSDGIRVDNTITLSCTNGSDFILSSSYDVLSGGTIKVADGVTFSDGTNNYSGTLTTEQIDAIKDKKLIPVHTHSFTYSASGATITATCSSTVPPCGLTDSKTTLTIAAPESLTYDGTAKAATLTDESNIKGSAAISYQKKTGDNTWGGAMATAPTDAGTYKASITLGEGEGAATASVEYTIAPKSVTITGLSAENKTYDGTTTATVTGTAAISGLETGDTVTVMAGAASFADANVGTGKTVIFSGYSLSGTDAGNYTLSGQPASVTVDITKKAVTVTAKAQTVEVDGTISQDVSNVELTGALEGHTLGSVTLTGDTSSVTTTGTITPSAAIIMSGTTDMTGNYDITYENGTLTVTKKQITVSGITASNKDYDGNTTATLDCTNAVLTGKADGDTVTVNATGTFDSKNVGTGKTVTISGLTLAGVDAGKYDLAPSGHQASTTANITAKSVTINGVMANNRDYVADNLTVGLSGGTVSGKVGSDDVTVDLSTATGTMADANAGVNKAVSVTGVKLAGTDAGNYVLSAQPTDVTVTINKATNPATVTGTASVTRGGNTVDLSANVLTNGATGAVTYEISDDANGCALNGSVLTSGANTGSVTINVTIAADGNYEALAATPIAVTITDKATQTIAFADASVSKTYGDADFTIAATRSVGDGTVSYSATNGTGEITIDSATGKVHIVKAGTSTVTATAAETLVYAPATASYTLTVNPKTVAIPAAATGLKYTGSEQTGVASGEGYTVIDGSKTYAGNYTATATLNSTTNYKWSDDTTEAKSIAWSIGKVTPTISTAPVASAITYGETLNESTLSGGEASVPGSFSWTDNSITPAVADSNATAYSVTFTPTDATNYDSTTTTVTLTVNRKSVTITGLGASNKEYDATTAATITGTATIDGKVGSDDVSVSAGSAAFSSANVGTGIDVTFSGYSLSGTAADNYTLSAQPASVTANITQKAVTVTAIPQTIDFGGSIRTGTGYATLTGAVSGHTLAAVTLTSNEDPTSIGIYQITPSAATIKDASNNDVTGNYNIAYTDGQLTVNKATAKVTTVPTANNRTYNGQAAALLTGGAANTSLEYSTDGTSFSATVPQGTNADSYTVYYRAVGDDNHEASDAVQLTVTISKAPLTVTANNKAITYGDAPANDGVRYSGFVNGENEGVLGGTLAYAYNYERYGDVGSYAITPNGLTSGNYDITYTAGTLTVGQKEVGLTWSATPLTYNGQPQAPTATATGLVNGDSIGVTVNGQQINADTGYTATASALTGDKAGNYALPNANTTNFSIGKASHANESANGSAKYGNSGKVDLSALIVNGGNVGNLSTMDGNSVISGAPSVAGGKLSFAFANDGAKVGKTATVTVPVTSANYANYNIVVTLTVLDKDAPALTANAITKTYDGSAVTNAQISGTAKVGETSVAGTWAFKVGQSLTNVADSGAKTVVFTPTDTANYKSAETTLTLTVTAKSITGATVTLSATELTYSGASQSVTVTDVKLNGKAMAASDYTVSGSTTGTDVDTYTVTVTGQGNYKESATATWKIVQKPVTITGLGAANKTYDGKTSATVTGTAAISGKVNGDDVSVSAGVADFASAGAGTGKTVTFSGYSLTGGKAKNYTLSAQPASVKANITEKEIGLSWSNTSFTYDGNSHAPTATATGLIGSDSCTVTVSGAQINAGNHAATATSLSNANYALPTANTKAFSIGKKTVGLTWANTSFAYDGKSHVPTATASGLVGSDACTVTVTGAQTNAGSYTATASTLSNANYALPAVKTQAFSISKKAVGLSWSNTSFTYDGKSHAPTATATGLIGSDTCTVTVTGAQTNAGSHTATAASLSNANYALPTANTKSFTISKKTVGLSWANTSFTYDGKSHVPTATATGLVGSDVCTVTVTGAQTSAGSYTATASTLSNANYALPTANTKAFSIGKKTVGLTWANTSFTYDGNSHVPTATATALIGSDACTVTVTGAQTNAGSHTATASSLSNANYALPTAKTQAFNISLKVL